MVPYTEHLTPPSNGPKERPQAHLSHSTGTFDDVVNTSVTKSQNYRFTTNFEGSVIELLNNVWAIIRR